MEDFVRTHTKVCPVPLCPELGLCLATEVTPLWEATEDFLAREGLAPPFWAFCWPGGQALARCILDSPDLVRGRRVLDFGAGGGVAAIAAMMAGASAVTAVDVDPLAGAAMMLNAKLNEVSFEIVIDDIVGETSRWDLILAGDVCYERQLADPLTAWLVALRAEGTEVVIADPGRAYLPASGLSKIAGYRVPTSLDLEDAEFRDTVIYRLQGAIRGPS